MNNKILKETLTKFVLETGAGWPDFPPLTLLHAHCTPYWAGFSPFEILYGRPPLLLPLLKAKLLSETTNHFVNRSLQALQALQTELHLIIKAALPDNGPF